MRRSRIISCQGSIQLVNGLAAANVAPRPADVKDYLVIHDLVSLSGPADDFADLIRRAALILHGWERIVYLAPEQLAQIHTGPGRPADRLAVVRELIGAGDADELLLNAFPTTGSAVLRAAYPSATRVSCGDGLGVNYSYSYFVPSVSSSVSPPPPLSAPRRTVRRARRLAGRVRSMLFPPAVTSILADDRIDEHRLLLPGLFDEPAPPHVKTDPDFFRSAFAELGALLDDASGTWLADAEVMLRQAERVFVFLPSNFSEIQRTSRGEELRAYAEVMSGLSRNPGSVIVIKPHPRDTADKLDQLREVAAQFFEHVVVLSDPITFYLPFETIYARFARAVPSLPGKVTAICFSSACLSLEYLYRVPCRIGFGSDLSRRIFVPAWKELRVRHENDLRRAIVALKSNAER